MAPPGGRRAGLIDPAGRTDEAFGLAARIDPTARTDEALGLAAR
jgi:hypothetical protein